jgi:hypothetical protein
MASGMDIQNRALSWGLVWAGSMMHLQDVSNPFGEPGPIQAAVIGFSAAWGKSDRPDANGRKQTIPWQILTPEADPG